MLHRLIVAAALAAFFGAVTLPTYTVAQSTTTEQPKETKKAKKKEDKSEAKSDTKSETKTTKKAEKKEKKKLTPAQQKFSDCAKSWGDHKKETGEKTRKQYNAYMSKCIKKQA